MLVEYADENEDELVVVVVDSVDLEYIVVISTV